MRDMLDSSLLRCFLAVFEHRKLTVAASHLCLTQPALSKRLRGLEEELGVALFERSPGGMVPTPYGIALARRAHAIELESRRARSELQVLQEGGVGSVTIGTGPLWSVHTLPEVIGRLARQHSQLRVRIIPGVLDTLLPQLLKGELDVVCAALDFPDQPGLVKERLIDSTHVVIAHHTHPLAGSPQVSPEQLRTCAFVGLHNDYAVLERMDRFFSLRGLVSPGFAAEAGSLELLLSLVGTGAFVASQSHQVLERAGLLGIRQLAGDCSFWQFEGGLVYREGALTAPARLFCDAMREHSAAVA